MMSTTERTIKSPLFAYEIWNMISSDEENEEEHENVVDNVDDTDACASDTPRHVNEPIKRSFGLTHTVLNALLPTILLS